MQVTNRAGGDATAVATDDGRKNAIASELTEPPAPPRASADELMIRAESIEHPQADVARLSDRGLQP